MFPSEAEWKEGKKVAFVAIFEPRYETICILGSVSPFIDTHWLYGLPKNILLYSQDKRRKA